MNLHISAITELWKMLSLVSPKSICDHKRKVVVRNDYLCSSPHSLLMPCENGFVLCYLPPSLEFASWERELGNKYILAFKLHKKGHSQVVS